MAEVASAYVTLLPSAKGFAKKAEGEIGPGMTKAGSSAGDKASKAFGGRFKSGIKTAAKAGALALAAAGAVGVSFAKDAIAEARESQKVGALTESVIKATGGAANVTAKQVGDLAGALSAKTGIDDEVIQSGQNMLLTFKNVRNEAGKGNDIFNQSTETLIDMAAAMGTEPKQAAIQLGKALNDPIAGISALSRVGVTFTEQQKDQIKSLVASGKTMEAQKIVLRELNSEFGGAAEAQATWGDKAAVAWGNFKEQVGTAMLPMLDKLGKYFTNTIVPALSSFVAGMQDGTGVGGRFVGVLRSARDALSATADFVKRNSDVIVPLVGALGAAVAVIKIIGVVTRTWAAAQALLNAVMAANPVSLVIIAIAALAAGLVLAYKKSETFRNIVDTAFRAVANAGKWMWEKALKPAFSAMGKAIQAVGRIGIWLWNNIYAPVFRFLVKGVAEVMDIWAKMLRTLAKVPGFGWAEKAADAMQKGADKARGYGDSIKDIPDSAITNIKTPGLDAATMGVRAYSGYLSNLPAEKRTKIITERVNYAEERLGSRAHGGPATRSQPYLVGERGPEIFVPNTAGRIVNNRDARAMGGSGMQVTQHIYETTDPRATAAESARRLAFAGG